MKRKVKISELEARLSEHLREVQQGYTITVMDQDRPIAEIVPLKPEKPELTFVNRADRSKKLGDFKLPPLDPPIPKDVDVVALLLEMRQNDR